MKQLITLIAIVAAVALLAGCVQQQSAPTPTPGQQLVGGDRDVHGCIPSAGYSWCEAKQKCFRPWEENCTTTTASATATLTPFTSGGSGFGASDFPIDNPAEPQVGDSLPTPEAG